MDFDKRLATPLDLFVPHLFLWSFKHAKRQLFGQTALGRPADWTPVMALRGNVVRLLDWLTTTVVAFTPFFGPRVAKLDLRKWAQRPIEEE